MSIGVIIPTLLGGTRLVVTQGDHIFAQSTRHYLSDETGEPWVINGVEYAGSFHCNCYDGVWSGYRDSFGHDYTSVHLSRGIGQPDPSEAAKRKAIKILSETIGKWAASHPVELAQAELDYRRDLAARAKQKENDASNALLEACEKTRAAEGAVMLANELLEAVKAVKS